MPRAAPLTMATLSLSLMNGSLRIDHQTLGQPRGSA
jgi:hypothetical protein